MKRHLFVFVGVLLGCGAATIISPPVAAAQGCGPNASKPSIAGVYVDNFGGLQAVSKDFWVSGSSVFEVCSVDDATKQIVARNHDRNEFNPGKFSRFDWTEAGGRFWYCQTVFDAATLKEAEAAALPDKSDPATKGCGAFAWSTLIGLLHH